MKLLTQWIVRKVIPNYHDVDNLQVRARHGTLEAWTSIIGNLLLFAVALSKRYLSFRPQGRASGPQWRNPGFIDLSTARGWASLGSR